MTSSIAISLSGLQAASTRLAVAGSNIVNARGAGGADGAEGEGLHRPLRVEQSAAPGGGTRAIPVDFPDLSLNDQMVEMKLAKIAYQANLAALEAGDEILGELLDATS